MSNAKSFQNGNIELLPFCREHVNERYLGWINDPVTMRFTEARYRAYSRDEAEAYVEASNASPFARLFRILVDNIHVGNLRLSDINYFHHRADMAIIIGEPGMRGKGIGPAAIDLGARHAFLTMSLHKVTAGMYSVNQASIRAFEKAGFQQEAVLKGHYLCEGARVDGILFGRLAPSK